MTDRVLFTEAELAGPHDPTPAQVAVLRALLESAEARMQVPIAEIMDASPGANMWVWDAYLMEFGVAHLRTGDARFLDRGVELVRAIAPVWRTIEKDRALFDPVVLASLLKFEELVGDHLDRSDRTLLHDTTIEISEFLGDDFPRRDHGDRERTPWNHAIMVASAIGVAGVALPDHPDAGKWLDVGLDRARLFLDEGVSDAGMTWEGLHYCGYVFRLLGPLLTGLRLTGRGDVLTPEGSAALRKLHRIPEWYAHSVWPRGQWLQNYNDSTAAPYAALMAFLPTFAPLEPEISTAVWSLLVGSHGTGTYGVHQRFASVADAALSLPAVEPDPAVLQRLPLDLHCPEIGYVASRDRWRGGASVVTFNCGGTPCEMHDQSDNLSFTYINRGRMAVIDSGTANDRSEGSASSSDGHNLVFIDGRAELPAGEGTRVDGTMGDVRRSETYTAFVADATASYAAEGYNPVHHATRQLVFVRRPHPYLVVFDDIRKDDAEHRYESRLHVPFAPKDLGDGTVELATSRYGDIAQERQRTWISALHPPGVDTVIGHFGGVGPPFSEHETVGFVTTAINPEMVTLLASGDAPKRLLGHDVEQDDHAVTVRLHWRRGTDELRFQRHDAGRTVTPATLVCLPRAERSQPRSTAPLPDFLLIGAQKSATRWLRTVLGEHPDVHTAEGEVMYFSNPARIAEEGPEWYREQFPDWAGEPIVGEASTSYMAIHRKPDEVAERIEALLPGVKLIALLRNPVDRAVSAFNHHIRYRQIPEGASLMEHVRTVPPESDRLIVVGGGRYAASLRPYIERYGDRLLLLIHEDIHDDALGLYRRAAAHVGADAGFTPPSLSRRVGAAPKKAPKGDRLTPQDRAELFELYRDDIAELEAMTGLDLDRWRPESERSPAASAAAAPSDVPARRLRDRLRRR